MSGVIHFDLSADDPKRAAKFYKSAFDWKVEKWAGPEDYWIIQTGSKDKSSITGGIVGRIKPHDTTTVIFDVESLDSSVEKILKAGGKIRENKKVIPGVGYLVMCNDTEGNTFGIMQIDDSAK